MSRQKITIVLTVIAIIIGAGAVLVWLNFQQSQQTVDDYTAYREETRSQLINQHDTLAENWDVDSKSISELDTLLTSIDQQIGYLSQRKEGLPEVANGLFALNHDIDRSTDEKCIDDITASYQELRARVEVKRDSEQVDQKYVGSSQTMKDYQRAMSDLSKLAKEQAAKSYANQTDHNLATQYAVIVTEAANVNQAESSRDRPAYDVANRKIDQADQQIRSMNDAINQRYEDILSDISDMIDRLGT